MKSIHIKAHQGKVKKANLKYSGVSPSSFGMGVALPFLRSVLFWLDLRRRRRGIQC